jgi:hypothetical protein
MKRSQETSRRDNMKKLVLGLLCSGLLFATGCASVFTGSSDRITFNSTPKGAKVEINGMKVGRTPVTVPVKRNLSAPQVRLSLDGYEPQDLILQNDFNVVACLDIFFWPSAIIDLATGAIMKYSVLNYDVDLTPDQSAATTPKSTVITPSKTE